ncbi:MAG TPA: hypothetical protein VKX49_27015 [Bryobacteraceae bacterium]|nr:hypothetical protein [Bryobacteraceae bacterium]
MPTLYVENVPDDVYDALRAQAKANRRSIAAETISLLEHTLPTRTELRRRVAFYKQIQGIRSQTRGAFKSKGASKGLATEELLREDRNR